MVKRLAVFLSATLLASSSFSAFGAAHYRLGDEATEDIPTPIPLVVPDSEATAALKQKEARRVPAIYRYYPHALDEVEAAFHSTFARTRSNFIEAARARFTRENLTAEDTESKEFQRFLRDFQKQNVLFPPGLPLARAWATGESDQEFEAPLIEHLRNAMKAYVRSDTAPKDIWVGSSIRLISAADNEIVDEHLVEERGLNIPKTNFVSVTRIKTELLNLFPVEDRSIGKYVASFVKPNCIMEADLIRELRAQKTMGLIAADHYRAGQIIVKRGELINVKKLAALDQLETELGSRSSPETKAEKSGSFQKLSWVFWAIIGSVGALLMGFTFIWKAAKHRARAALLPAGISSGSLTVALSSDALPENVWRERALDAERRADQAQSVVRSGLVGQLAQWMAHRMTQKLVSDRAELLEVQQRAAVEMAELAERLEKIHAPLQERLLAYEQRIADLEKELSLKTEENRELIRAKIEIIRKQWEIEREQNRLEFN